MATSDVLTPNDLGRVLAASIEAQSQWFNVGLLLKVPEGQLKAIKVDFDVCRDCLREQRIGREH